MSPLYILFQVGFINLGVFFKGPYSALLGDSFILHQMAHNYLNEGIMRYGESITTLFQLPLYPLLLSCFYNFFGEDPRYVLGFQILITSLFLPYFALSFKESIGRWCYLIYILLILDLHTLLYSSCLLTEYWVWLFWMSSLLCVFKYQKKQRARYLYIAFLMMGLAANTKPLSVYYPIFLVICLLIFNYKFLLERKKEFLVGVLLFIVSLSPLLLRNYQLTGEFPRYSTISSFNAWYFNIAYHQAARKGISIMESREQLVNRMREYLNQNFNKSISYIPKSIAADRSAHKEALELNEYEYAKIAEVLSAKYLKEHFLSYLYHHLKHSISIFSISNLSWLKLYFNEYDAFSMSEMTFGEIVHLVLEGDKKSLLMICRFYEIIFIGVILLSATLYCCLKLRHILQSLPELYAVSMIGYVTLITGINVWGRFRYLIMPMLILLSVLGVRHLYHWYFRQNRVVS